MQGILEKWRLVLAEPNAKLSHKELLSDRGFLVYVTRTYPPMVPCLKGFHLTIKMWQGSWHADGWKLKEGDDSLITSLTMVGELDVLRAGTHGLDLDKAATYSPTLGTDKDEAALDHQLRIKSGNNHLYAPWDGLMSPVTRLKDNIQALQLLSDFCLPPLRVVRPAHIVHVYYGFGDASGKQFGATLSSGYDCLSKLSTTRQDAQGIWFRVGLWLAIEETKSSNYKELRNLVVTVSEEAKAGRMKDCKFFLFTNNSTAEGCFYRGNSKSRRLHELVLDLRRLKMGYGMTIHVVHISGKRMIAQGTDGCSRRSLLEGVMAGANMLMFVDLARGGIERHPPLLNWVRSWMEQPDFEPLTLEGWFKEGHGITGSLPDRRNVWIPTHCGKDQMFLWAPAPAVVDAAMEELLKSRHKQSDIFHVVVILWLMAPRWR